MTLAAADDDDAAALASAIVGTICSGTVVGEVEDDLAGTAAGVALELMLHEALDEVAKDETRPAPHNPGFPVGGISWLEDRDRVAKGIS